MLKLKNVSKTYKSSNYAQKALDDITLKFDDCGFVAILGQSGSGKTTLLNLIGGLDTCDEAHGEIEVDNIVTKKYREKDWNAYRNHKIGFIFQHYNLIKHQTVLENVELALTISGVHGKEREDRAKLALKQVDLSECLDKYPNQLSGGQAQRVAIARAIVNNPSIILADEPTGALDSKTSIQIMKLLKDISESRLVIMVTHNKKLAMQYATRIISIKDGKVVSDNPIGDDTKQIEFKDNDIKNTSMSLIDIFKLSISNLKTKKMRTIITSFAGSLGISGIALVLSVSNCISEYINNMQKNMLTTYPINIESKSIGIDLLTNKNKAYNEIEDNPGNDGIVHSGSSYNNYSSSLAIGEIENNLEAFKLYLDNKNGDIYKYIGDNGVVYNYEVKYGIYTFDSNGHIYNIDEKLDNTEESSDISDILQFKNVSNQVSSELISSRTGDGISDIVVDNYDILYGRLPQNYDELILNVNDNGLPYSTLCSLGLITYDDYKLSVDDSEYASKNVGATYEDIVAHKYYLIPACDILDNHITRESVENGIELHIVGVVKRKENCAVDYIKSPVGYTKALTKYIIQYTDNNELVKKQREHTDIDVFTNRKFEDENAEKEKALKLILPDLKNKNSAFGIAGLNGLGGDEVHLELESCDKNLKKLGAVDINKPASIQIYVDSFNDKNSVAKCIEDYNGEKDIPDKIIYSDYIGLAVDSLTSITQTVSFILIAFVGISLIVSSIMIGIITCISVLERTKEIGILRSLGVSRFYVTQMFNMENFIIGLLSGVIGVLVNYVLLIPINVIIRQFTGIDNIVAILTIDKAIYLLGLSILLNVLSGIVPAIGAAKKNTIDALNSE